MGEIVHDYRLDCRTDKVFQGWYCLRTQMKRESFAWKSLVALGFNAFFPRIRYPGQGRRVGQWVVEPLFPNYLFCQFNLQNQTRQVRYAPGVSSLIHFGNHCPEIPSWVIEELQLQLGGVEPIEIRQTVKIGDRVLVESGPMQGGEGTVCMVVPAKNRAVVLLEFLGQQTPVEMDLNQLELSEDWRQCVVLTGSSCPVRASATW